MHWHQLQLLLTKMFSFFVFFCSTSHHILLCLHDECGGQRLAAEHDTGLCKVIYSDLGPSMQAPGRVTVTLSPKSLKTQQRRRGFNSPSIQLNCELKLLLVIINRSFSNDSFRDWIIRSVTEKELREWSSLSKRNISKASVFFPLPVKMNLTTSKLWSWSQNITTNCTGNLRN